MKYVAVLLDDKLKFREHINSVDKKADKYQESLARMLPKHWRS